MQCKYVQVWLQLLVVGSQLLTSVVSRQPTVPFSAEDLAASIKVQPQSLSRDGNGIVHSVVRAQPRPPFFLFQGGKPLSKPRFIVEVRKALTMSGLNQTSFSGHSFHIRAATAAAQVGVPNAAIQTLGRWSSAAFITYMRMPCQRFASVMKSIL